MILVTLGTHEQPFERALDFVSELERQQEDVVVQHGATPPRDSSPHVTWVAYLAWDELHLDDGERRSGCRPTPAWDRRSPR